MHRHVFLQWLGFALQSCDVIRLWMQLDAVLAYCEHSNILMKLAVIVLGKMKVSPFHLYEISDWPQLIFTSDSQIIPRQRF